MSSYMFVLYAFWATLFDSCFHFIKRAERIEDEERGVVTPVQSTLSNPRITIVSTSDLSVSDAATPEATSQNMTTDVPSGQQSNAPDFTQTQENFQQTFEILDVLEKYGRHVNATPETDNLGVTHGTSSSPWCGRQKFFPHVNHQVQQGLPIQLMMPAFPFKSSNRTNKVLGHLPDLGEELALKQLQRLTDDIQQVYAPGAIVEIASDGVLFNDIVNIMDEETWEYGKAIKALIQEKRLTSVKLTRATTILNTVVDEEMNREVYLASIQHCRAEIDRLFDMSAETLTARIKTETEMTLLYRGMLRFMKIDLQFHPEVVDKGINEKERVTKKKVRKMIRRSEAYNELIRRERPYHVRLSIHQSSGAAELSFPLVPNSNGGFKKAPWHSCVLLGLDGSYKSVHTHEVDSHDLVYRYGRPYFYKERAAIRD